MDGFEQWDEWKAIDAYKTARNSLAHHGGLVRKKGDQKKVAKLPKLDVESFGLLSVEPTIFVDAGACEAAAENARAFFERLATICQHDPRAK